MKRSYTLPPTKAPKTFRQAIIEHGLTEREIETKRQRFYLFSLFFLTYGLTMGLLAVDALWHAKYLQSLGYFVIVPLCLAWAFKYHFWYFQITRKRLGNSFSDWVNFVFKL